MKRMLQILCWIRGYHKTTRHQIFERGPSEYDVFECDVCGFADNAWNYKKLNLTASKE